MQLSLKNQQATIQNFAKPLCKNEINLAAECDYCHIQLNLHKQKVNRFTVDWKNIVENWSARKFWLIFCKQMSISISSNVVSSILTRDLISENEPLDLTFLKEKCFLHLPPAILSCHIAN